MRHLVITDLMMAILPTSLIKNQEPDDAVKTSLSLLLSVID